MTTQNFTILGRLPSGRDLEKAARKHWAVHQKLKNEAMAFVHIAMLKAKTKKTQGPIEVEVVCYEPNLKRDEDNVKSGAMKVILDAMQTRGIIKNDNRKGVSRQTCTVTLDRERPRIEVTIKETETNERIQTRTTTRSASLGGIDETLGEHLQD